MIIIADSGSTKTTWCLINEAGTQTLFETEGYNPCYTGKEQLVKILKPNLPQVFDYEKVTKAVFYGAGVYEDKYSVIQEAIRSVFSNAQVDAAMDLMGSARALLGETRGFAAILGTGSNSCIYNGKEITHYIDSLGFMLGDEGSGGYMGKRLIGDFIRGTMPQEVSQKFFDTYQLTNDELIDRIYANPTPNRYCASFARFLTGELAGHDYLEQHIIIGSFRDFFRNIVSLYPNYQAYSFNCVGTIGHIFRDRLTLVAHEFGMEIGNIIPTPMEGLIRYHAPSIPR